MSAMPGAGNAPSNRGCFGTLHYFLDCLWKVLVQGDTAPIEIFASIRIVLWGFWLLLPFNTFDSLPRVYGTMQRIADETTWGILATGLGLWLLVGVATGDYRWRKTACFFGFLFWFMLGVMHVAHDYRTTIYLQHLANCMVLGWAYIRDSRTSRHINHYSDLNRQALDNSDPTPTAAHVEDAIRSQFYLQSRQNEQDQQNDQK